MEWLQNHIDQIPGFLEAASQFVGSTPWSIKAGAAAIPVLIALFSRHLITILAALLLSMMAVGILAAPTSAPTTLVLGGYAGALLVALAGIGHRRRQTALRTELAILKSNFAELSDAEQRRLLAQLKSPARAHENE